MCVTIITRQEVSLVSKHSASLNELCSRGGKTVPEVFKLYSSYCCEGAIWKQVQMGEIILFAIFQENTTLALAVVSKKDGGWEAGVAMSLPKSDDALRMIVSAQSTFVRLHSNPPSPDVN